MVGFFCEWRFPPRCKRDLCFCRMLRKVDCQLPTFRDNLLGSSISPFIYLFYCAFV